MNTTIRLFRDADVSGGGSGPTLADLTDPNYNPTPPAGDPPAGDPPPPVEGLNEDGTVKDGYRKEADGIIVKIEDTQIPEGSDEDGNPLEGYEKLADGTFKKKEDANDDGDPDPTEEAKAFWETVSGITGEKYDIDFGEVDPISPEGVALREKHVKEKAAQDFENYLKSSFPKAYAYMLHLEAGKSDSEFFENATPTLPSREDFENNTDLHASVVLNDLTSRGVDADIAQAQIDKAIKDNTLKAKAMKIYDTTQATQSKQLADIEAFNKQRQDEFNKSVDNLLKQIDTTVTSDTMAFIVPETKQAEFKKFVQDHIRFNDNEFFITQKIEAGNMPKLLEQLLFSFNGGNLKGIIERQAKTIASQRLRSTVNKDKQHGNSGTQPAAKPNTFVPLGDI